MKFNRDQLIRAVSEPEEKLVYSFGCNPKAGFGADYLGFLSKLMMCLNSGIGFRFCRIKHPQGFVTQKGWTDYFEPFCQEVSGPLLERINIPNFPYARKIPVLKFLSGAWLRLMTKPRADYFVFDNLLTKNSLGPPIFEENENWLYARRDLIRLIWIYNPETRNQVEAVKRELMISDDYLAICVRRGDKNTEHAYVDVDSYIDLINSTDFGVRKIFIATDDAAVIPEISAALPDYELMSLTEPNSRGYVHTEFKTLPPMERRRRTIRFFAQLEFLRDAKLFIGSKTTNVSWMANALRGGEGVVWVD